MRAASRANQPGRTTANPVKNHCQGLNGVRIPRLIEATAGTLSARARMIIDSQRNRLNRMK